MNEKIPVHNNTKIAIYVGSEMIPAGETRHFYPHQVPENLRPGNPPKPAEAQVKDPIQAMLEGNVPEIIVQLPDLNDDGYAALKRAEEAAEKPRKGLLAAFAEEDLRRANEKSAAAETADAETVI